MGWLPDYPDFRDYTPRSEEIKPLLLKTGIREGDEESLPASTDLRQWCPPVEDQETIGSCTANAGAAIVEYYERRAFGKHIDASRLFLYKVTRNLLGWEGDSGAFSPVDDGSSGSVRCTARTVLALYYRGLR